MHVYEKWYEIHLVLFNIYRKGFFVVRKFHSGFGTSSYKYIIFTRKTRGIGNSLYTHHVHVLLYIM